MSDIQLNTEHVRKASFSVQLMQFGIVLTGIGFTCMLALSGTAEKWTALVLVGGYIVYLVNERSAFERIREDIVRDSEETCRRRCAKRTIIQTLVAGPVIAAFVLLFVHSTGDVPAWILALPWAMVCVMDFVAAQVLFKRFDESSDQPLQE